MQCKKCSGEAPAGSVFCPACGARLDHAEEGTFADDQPGGTARLRAEGRRGSGQQPPEEDIWTGTYSPKAMYGSFLAAAVLTAIGLVGALLFSPIGWAVWGAGISVVWGFLGVLLLYRRLTVRYRLSTYRFFHEQGLFNRIRDRVEVIRIEDVTVEQRFIERIFGVGTVVIICSSDQSHPELRLKGIEDPRNVADVIDNTRRAERNRRGMFMENV
ncbi:MAG: PH domain-containing protein [Pirellulales bacterium]